MRTLSLVIACLLGIAAHADVTYPLASGGSSSASGANPTGTIGLSAVNGSATTFTRSDGAPALSQAITPIWTGVHEFLAAPASNTNIDSIDLFNTTAAPSTGNQSYSGSIHFQGQGWKTTATAGSQSVDWLIYDQPVQGTTSPSTNLVFSRQINGGGYLSSMTLSSTAINFGNTTDNSTFSFLGTGSISSAGQFKNTNQGTGGNASFLSASNDPEIAWDVSNQGTNAKFWAIGGGGLVLNFRTDTDSNTGGSNYFTITRNSANTTIASLAYGNTTDLPPHTFNGAVYSTSGAAFTVSGCGTAGTIRGNSTSGTFVVGTGAATCTFIITPGLTASTGWVANIDDVTAVIHCPNSGTIASTTTATAKCNSTVATGDLITVHLDPF